MRIGILWCCLAIGTLVSGCGDDDDDDGPGADAGTDAAPGHDASVDAGRDAAPADGGEDDAGGGPALEWEACGIPFECATLVVPLDHTDPDGATIELALARVPAQSPPDRIGAVLVNPGGPGASAIQFLRGNAAALAQFAPDLARDFDVVAFDPRGMGDSTRMDCLDDDRMAVLATLDTVPDDEEENAALIAWAQELVAGCEARSPDLARHVDTESVARDMDLIREALGEETISYWGTSYGTVLGATYATLFPDRVRAFVLDSPVWPAADLPENQSHPIAAYEVELGRFMERCGARGQCTFHGGDGTAAVEAAYDAVRATLELGPIPAGEDELTETLFLNAMTTLIRGGNWDGVEEGLVSAQAGDGTALAAVGALATQSLPLESSLPVLLLDFGCPEGFDAAAAEAFLADARAASPRLGSASAPIAAACALWPLERPTPKTPIDASLAPPMLVMAGEHDPATPYAGVDPFMAALANESYLVTWQGNGHGIAFRNGCTIGGLVDFLLDPGRGPRNDLCSP